MDVDREKAFDVFTARMGTWWNPSHQIGAQPFVDAVVEPRTGGRWYEVDAAGVETEWGKVLAWDRPERLVLAWQLTGELVRRAFDEPNGWQGLLDRFAAAV